METAQSVQGRFGAAFDAIGRQAMDDPAEGPALAWPSAGPASYYIKILVTNQLAGVIIGSAGQEIKSLKNTTGAKIVLSPHGMYFPGTSERIAAIEGSEKSVLTALDWIIDKLSDQVAPSNSSNSIADECTSVAASVPLPQYLCTTTMRVCVPRAVVGSLIGKNGGYIQSLRVSTGATINISPLFVAADEACAERIITVESRKKQNLRTAVFTLIRKINEHIDKATCKHVCYFKKLSFEAPSQLSGCLDTTETVSSQLGGVGGAPGSSRTRTVSQVFGDSHPTSDNLSALRATEGNKVFTQDKFATFSRFCEARTGNHHLQTAAKASLSSCETLPSRTASVKQVSDLKPLVASKLDGCDNSGASRESISTVCSSPSSSRDRLPYLTHREYSLMPAHSTNNLGAFKGAAAHPTTKSQAKVAHAVPQQSTDATAAAAAAFAAVAEQAKSNAKQNIVAALAAFFLAVLISTLLQLLK